MKVGVTGASGFIGKLLCQALLARGEDVVILSRRNEVNLSGVKVCKGDITGGAEALATFTDGLDVIFNCAGELKDEALMHSVHVEGTKALLSSVYASIKRSGRPMHWVQLSSVGAYGPVVKKSNVERIVTEVTISAPLGTYEITKTQADDLIISAKVEGVLSYSILRPSNVYGVGMPNNSIRQWAKMIKKRLFFYVGPPGAVANYVHVEDVVDALMLCGFDERAKGEVFNISNDCSQECLVGAMSKTLNVPIPSLRVPEYLVRVVVSSLSWVKGFPLSHSRVDALMSRTHYPVSKLASVLGYRPRRVVEETIAEVLFDKASDRQ